MNEPVWTISNGLSTLRLLLALPIAVFLARDDQGARAWLFALIALAVLTDFFDGLAARRLRQVTELGKVLDPVADKIVVGTIAVLLTVRGAIPVWFVAAVIARDCCILAGAWYLRGRQGSVAQSNILGKWSVTVTAAYLVSALALGAPHWMTRVLLPASCAMLALSFVAYARRFVAGVRIPVPPDRQS